MQLKMLSHAASNGATMTCEQERLLIFYHTPNLNAVIMGILALTLGSIPGP
jgi:hypothetical protein